MLSFVKKDTLSLCRLKMAERQFLEPLFGPKCILISLDISY